MLFFVYQTDKAQKSSNPKCNVLSLGACEIDFQQFSLWSFKYKNTSVQGSIFIKNVFRSMDVADADE